MEKINGKSEMVQQLAKILNVPFQNISVCGSESTTEKSHKSSRKAKNWRMFSIRNY